MQVFIIIIIIIIIIIAVSYVGPRNKAGDPNRRHERLMQLPVLNVRGISNRFKVLKLCIVTVDTITDFLATIEFAQCIPFRGPCVGNIILVFSVAVR